MTTLTATDVDSAARRLEGGIRPVAVVRADELSAASGAEVHLALEFQQHTGSFKARGALNFLRAHQEAGTVPDAGVVIASGGNAGLACAWAAGALGIPATVFVPETIPASKIEPLGRLGADVRLVGREYAEALEGSRTFAAETGALLSHAYDHPLIAAGAGTLVDEIRAQVPGLQTVVVAVGGGGLFAGVATAAARHGIRTLAVEPRDCRALHAALEAGEPVPVTVASVAADSLGARVASRMALEAARHPLSRSLLVTDAAIVDARRALWRDRRLAVEHAAATAVAALRDPAVYAPEPGEVVAIVLCGANTDPSTLV